MQKYLQPERSQAHSQFANADGFPGNDLYFLGGNDNPGFFNAEGGGAAEAAPVRKAQPYVLNITNVSAAQVSNFDIFGAYEYLNTGVGTWANGSLTISGVTISSGLSNVTYQFLLAQSQTSPFSIGRTQIIVGSGSSTQANQPITVNTKDSNGNAAQIALTPLFSPFQQQTNTLILDQMFRIDGGTKLTMTILASVTFSLYLFPQDNINIARGLAGQPVAQSYANPQLGKAGTVQVLQR
jgi:hypothetical protein